MGSPRWFCTCLSLQARLPQFKDVVTGAICLRRDLVHERAKSGLPIEPGRLPECQIAGTCQETARARLCALEMGITDQPVPMLRESIFGRSQNCACGVE